MATNETIECPKCFGKGEVSPPIGMGSPKTTQFITCRMCEGTGKIPKERK